MIFSLPAFLTIGAILFCLGIITVIIRKNMIAILIGIELILNGAAINFVAFSFFNNFKEGNVMVLFIIALAALEAVIALAIILSIYKYFRTISIDQASKMQD